MDFWGFSRFLVFLFFNGIGLSKGFYVVLIDVWIIKYFYVISPFRFFASILVFSFPSDRLDSLVFSRTGQFFFRTGFFGFFKDWSGFSFGLDLFGFLKDWSGFSFGLDLLVSFLGLDYWFFGLFGFFPRIGSGLLLDV